MCDIAIQDPVQFVLIAILSSLYCGENYITKTVERLAEQKHSINYTEILTIGTVNEYKNSKKRDQVCGTVIPFSQIKIPL